MSRRERGSITAETAIVLPVLFAIAWFLVSAVGVVSAKIRCVDAAREAARAAARAESETTARQLADLAAPAGSRVTISTDGDRVTATVDTVVDLPIALSVTVHAVAIALREPDEEW